MKAQNQFSQSQSLRHAESGQAIVLLALVILALVAMLGLAIDGGGLYLLWRNAQNATDAAALAAAYARCTNKDMGPAEMQLASERAGLQAAAKNGFNDDGTTNDVTINYPPQNGEKKGDLNFVEAVIWAAKPSYFIQVIYREPLSVTNSAIGLCIPPFDPTKIGGLWAGSDHCLNTIKWGGSTSEIWGGMFSNYQIQMKGSDVRLYDLVVDGITYSGNVAAVDYIDPSSSDKIDWADSQDLSIVGVRPTGVEPQPDPLALPVSMYMPGGTIYEHIRTKYGLAYDVSTGTVPGWDADKKVWEPGKGAPYQLHGLYYVPGDVTFGNKVSFNQDKDAYGNYTLDSGFTIVATGDIVPGGTGKDIEMRYYGRVMDPVGSRGLRYPGIIFFTSLDESAGCGSDALKFSGPETRIWGIIYAPKGGMQVSGSYMRVHGTVLINFIDYGASDGDFIYDPSLLPPRPPAIQMAQ